MTKSVRNSVWMIAGVFILLIVGDISIRFYLRIRATRYWVVPDKSQGGKYQIAMYRYPQLRDFPECFGFGQGFVQLQETASGMVLAEKHADDLGPLNAFKWTATNVIIYRGSGVSDVFADWSLPR